MGETDEVTVSTAKFEIVATESTLSNFQIFLDVMSAVQKRGTYHHGGNGRRYGGDAIPPYQIARRGGRISHPVIG